MERERKAREEREDEERLTREREYLMKQHEEELKRQMEKEVCVWASLLMCLHFRSSFFAFSVNLIYHCDQIGKTGTCETIC